MKQINNCGVYVETKYPGMVCLKYHWRKESDSQQIIEISKQEQFYQQKYCGYVYSLYDTNRWRLTHRWSRIKIGVKYYAK